MSFKTTSSLRFASRQLPHTAKMPAFILHGGRTSTNTMRVRLTLSEGNFTDYEFANVNLLKGEQKVSYPFLCELHCFASIEKATWCQGINSSILWSSQFNTDTASLVRRAQEAPPLGESAYCNLSQRLHPPREPCHLQVPSYQVLDPAPPADFRCRSHSAL